MVAAGPAALNGQLIGRTVRRGNIGLLQTIVKCARKEIDENRERYLAGRLFGGSVADDCNPLYQAAYLGYKGTVSSSGDDDAVMTTLLPLCWGSPVGAPF